MTAMRVPLHVVLAERSGANTEVDERLINCYTEANGEGVMLVKRAGTVLKRYFPTQGEQGVASGNGRIYTIAGDVLYVAPEKSSWVLL